MQRPDPVAPSTRQPIVRKIRELIDEDDSTAFLMAHFITRAIEVGARDVTSADPPVPDGTMQDLLWPAWVGCARRILAKCGNARAYEKIITKHKPILKVVKE